MPTITASDQYKPIVSTTAMTVNYTFNPSTFLEATFGHSQNELAGCGLAQGGTGLARSVLCDHRGPVAYGAQSLLVARR